MVGDVLISMFMFVVLWSLGFAFHKEARGIGGMGLIPARDTIGKVVRWVFTILFYLMALAWLGRTIRYISL